MSLDHFLLFFIFFGGFFSLILALGQSYIKDKSKDNYFFIAFLLAFGFAQISAGLNYFIISDIFSSITYSSKVIFYLLVGPFTYYYFQNLIHFKSYLKLKMITHFIPCFIVSVIEPLIILQGLIRHRPVTPYPHQDWNLLQFLIFLTAIFAVIHLAFYMTLVLIHLFQFREKMESNKRKIVNLAIAITISSYIINLAWFLDKLVVIDFEKLVYCALTVLIIIIFLLGNRYPNFLFLIKLESIRIGYTKSHIESLNVPLVLNQLFHLMEKEKIYRDNQLTLKSLAEKCNISSHQLSEILNDKINKRYHDFVNEYRVNEAKKLLEHDNQRTILSVALTVGFHSQSAFYAACDRILKTSPGTLRKKN
ncbi:MAG: helix-turn-helix domain-containing protein [Spirochaetes bacterium]|nr:helix-turn-helix domain-containing protein [Spirochaetota bacterium]